VARGALHIQAVDADRNLTLGLRFNPAAIDHDDVSQIARYLRTLLRAIAAEPRARIAELPAPIHPEPDEEPMTAGLSVHPEPDEESVTAGLSVHPEPYEESVVAGPLSSDEAERPVMTQMREIWQEIRRPMTASAF
jgi:hypothetical protein